MYFHVAAYVILVLALLILSFYLNRKNKKLRIPFLISAGAVAVLGRFFSGRTDILLGMFPFSGTVFYANFYPFAAALGAPAAFYLGQNRFQRIRIAVLCTALLILSFIPSRFIGAKTHGNGNSRFDDNGVCLQSSCDTCSAAAGATLLHHYGIETSEKEVASLALTKKNAGTDRAGLYRALKLISSERGDLKVKLQRLSARELLSLNKPALITVGLRKNPQTRMEKDLARKFNWDPGAVHDVVFLGVDEENPGKVKIGEPQFGLERWKEEALITLFKGSAIFLE